MWMLLLAACLFDSSGYERRVVELTDADADGFGALEDCDDRDAGVSPGAVETCDGVDQDCDGLVDDDAVDRGDWYPDTDADGFGDSSAPPESACTAPPGHVANALDCDDAATGVHPGVEETPYDGVDDDCDGADLTDVDGDGHDARAAGGGDCDDADADVYPGREEEPYDGVDQDCSGGDADDLDGDGAVAAEAGGPDCDDADAAIFPTAEETWADGFTDNDCDGELEAVRLEYGAHAWIGESEGAEAGRRLGALGDVSGDGVAEYLVGALSEGRSYPDGGAVYLVPGGASSGALADAHVLLPGGASWYLPQVIEGAPDLDGDGVPDILATATGYESFAGAAFLVSGAALGAEPTLSLPGAAFGMVEGDLPGDSAGTGAAFLGDVVGDGGDYLGVSSLFATAPAGESAGLVSVFDTRAIGYSRMSEGMVVVEGPYADAGLGNLVAAAGDVDGDGLDDMMMSVEFGDLAYVVPGGVAEPSLPDDAIFRLTGTGAGEVGAAHMLGDVDGDGRRDLACIFEYDEVRVFTALAAVPIRTIAEPTATIALGEGGYGYDVLDLGDLDADGRSETLVPAQLYPDLATSLSGVVPGESLTFGAIVDVGLVALSAVSVRPESRFGHRVALSPDVDGDGGADILVGGYSDGEGGRYAGAALSIPLPR